MSSQANRSKSRRDFVRFLAASPLFALPRFYPFSLMNLLPLGAAEHAAIRREIEELQQSEFIITSPDQALDVFEFEAAARKALPPAHFGFLATGVDDDATVRANHEAYARYQIRSRRLVDVEHIDTSVRLLGTPWNTPIVICPVGGQRVFHPEGEIATARAARAKDHLLILSTAATTSVEDVTAACGAPVWYQLYANNVWEIVRTMIKRAEAAGCPALMLTLDLQMNSNRETMFRSRRYDSRQCSACHAEGFSGFVRDRPMFNGQDVSKVTGLMTSTLTWDYVKRLKDATTMKVFLKGIVTREDTELALQHGVDGIVV
jgi:isopentenyl diphosphate isomerase/L-lactate dehydrogenase-like FMN-dependent dehydrogenase